MRNILSQLLLLLIASLLLTACALAPPAPVDEPAAAAPSANEEKIIYLGAAVSETGKFSREGRDTRQGYGLWLDWVNNEYGGIKVGDERYKVELIMYDDEGDPDTAARLVEKPLRHDFPLRGNAPEHPHGLAHVIENLRRAQPALGFAVVSERRDPFRRFHRLQRLCRREDVRLSRPSLPPDQPHIQLQLLLQESFQRRRTTSSGRLLPRAGQRRRQTYAEQLGPAQ